MDFFKFAEAVQNYNVEMFLDDLQINIEKNQFVKQLQLQQWNEGRDADGEELGRYSKATEILTDGRKKAGELFDIFDTGETRRRLEVYGVQEDKNVTFYFDSKSVALPELLERIGDRLLGIEPKNIKQFVEISQGIAMDLLSKNLKLK